MFSTSTFKYLDELAANNKREWFETHKTQYESLVREPSMAFITKMATALEDFAPHFRADTRKVGGSLMRVYRDTRFARDKTPYKTNIGIQFRHELGKDVHAPGFYVHIATDECFLATGCWRPDPDTLGKIRDLITEKPDVWFAARDDQTFVKKWEVTGDSLKKPPRGYPVDHVAIQDLKRKDFAGFMPLSRADVLSPDFVELVSQRFSESVPLMRFLCRAIDVQY